MRRPAALAGSWYPGDAGGCRKMLGIFAARGEEAADGGPVLGGLAPHAGWAFSGPTAYRTFFALRSRPFRTVVLLGVPHRARIRRPSASTADAWASPLGDALVDRELRAALIHESQGLLAEDDAPHAAGENSIEVLVPFVRHLLPEAAVLPVAVPARREAEAFGEALGRVVLARREAVAVVGSTDLTHYGARFYAYAPRGEGREAHRWSKEENDRAFLDRVLALDARGALAEAEAGLSACGAGAAAAAIAACRVLGAAGGRLLQHVTSHEVCPEGPEPMDFVGYASLVFLGRREGNAPSRPANG